MILVLVTPSFAASNIKPTMSDRLLYFIIQEIFSYCVFIDDISILLIEYPLLGKKIERR